MFGRRDDREEHWLDRMRREEREYAAEVSYDAWRRGLGADQNPDDVNRAYREGRSARSYVDGLQRDRDRREADRRAQEQAAWEAEREAERQRQEELEAEWARSEACDGVDGTCITPPDRCCDCRAGELATYADAEGDDDAE